MTIEVFRLFALSGRAVDYCRYLSYYKSRGGPFVCISVLKSFIKIF